MLKMSIWRILENMNVPLDEMFVVFIGGKINNVLKIAVSFVGCTKILNIM